ncbi:GAF domain-containing protein [Nocardia sp. NPDC020380]|uniref:GAF domain-containing protein n=1 Tax=Nocardia sp. NPDC020380 TaxID=3364309 RepID=UPI00379AD08F
MDDFEPSPSRTGHIDDFLAGLTELTDLAASTPDLGATLQEVATVTARILPGRPTAAVTLRIGPTMSVATAGPFARTIDELRSHDQQAAAREAVKTARPVHIPDLTVDRRWTAYRAHLLAHGIHGAHAQPLILNDITLGSLNVYCAGPAEFDRHMRLAIALTAGHAAMVLGSATASAHQAELCGHIDRMVRHLFDTGLRLDRLRRTYERDETIPEKVRVDTDAVFTDLDSAINEAARAVLELAKAQLPARRTDRPWLTSRPALTP